MNIFRDKRTRALILIMCALALLAISVAKIYYSDQNNSVDPRIREARELYEDYNKYAQANNFDSVFYLMDTIESIYAQYDHYRNSYEVGVLYNNKAAACLTIALHVKNNDGDAVVDSLFNLAKVNAEHCILLYSNWLNKYDAKQSNELKTLIEEDFYIGLESYDRKRKSKYLKNRVEDIDVALAETKRRLSVSYTNLGLVYRHELKYEEAVKTYKKALDLWDRNLTARNNMNLLLNRPIEKRNLIQKIFPPPKDK